MIEPTSNHLPSIPAGTEDGMLGTTGKLSTTEQRTPPPEFRYQCVQTNQAHIHAFRARGGMVLVGAIMDGHARGTQI